MLVLRRDSFYALVVVWALAGIIIKRTASPNPEWPVVITAAVCGGLLLIGALVRLPAWLRV